MMLKKYFSTILIGIFLLGCEKEIQLPLDPNQSLLVIDGSITDEIGPYYIKLSKSTGISEASNFFAVTNAIIIVKDNHKRRLKQVILLIIRCLYEIY
jgi:hypothetical protein